MNAILIFLAFMPLCNGAFNSMLRKTRVVNGRTIRRSEWPFLVSLHYLHSFPFTSQTHMKHLCGGALINPRYVITAGHCVGFFKELQDVNNWNVVLGEHNQYLPDLGEQVIKPEKFFIHPGFQPFSTFTLQNDLALIKLNKDADLSTSFVNTIPLEEKQDIKELTQCEIGGWGQVSSEPYGYGMYIPLKTNLYVVNNDTCFEAYESLTYDVGDLRMVIDDTVLCAGVPYALNSKPDVDHGYNDACNGDSGSPLVCPTGPNKEYHLVGLVSAGKGCGTGRFPGIYTKVSQYIDWINDIIAKE